MKIAPKPSDEGQRLEFLHALAVLDTEPEERFDSITRLACQILGANFSVVSLVDSDRQWFKSKCGLDVSSTSRDVSFCAHTILEDQTMVVEDAFLDERFHDNPLVVHEPHLRAYLGHPLTVENVVLGALCVLYTEPRKFSSEDQENLRDLARLVEEMLAHQQFRDTAHEGMGELVSASDIILAKAIQMNSEPTMLVDLRDGTIADLNIACAEELRAPREQILGKQPPINPLLDSNSREEIESRLARDGKIKDLEIGLCLGDDERQQYICSAQFVFRTGSKYLLVTGRNVSSLKGRESLFRSAFSTTGGKTGDEYFRACAEIIAKELDVRYGLLLGVPTEDSESPRVLSFVDRENQIDGLPPSKQGLSSANLASGRAPIHIPHGVREKFPTCEILHVLGVDSYYSHPVISANDELCGYLIVMNTAPFVDESARATLLLGVLAARTAGELERQEMHRKLEEERERADVANQAKGKFLANMSHELRTPMNAIIGFSQLMAQDHSLPDEHQQTLQIVNQSGEHLLCLINDVLEMSAIEAGQMDIDLGDTELTTFLSSIASLLKIKAEEKMLAFTLTIAPDVPPVVRLDEGKVRQILINLIGNAIKFTDKGSVALHVTVAGSESAARGLQLCFEVADTGPGISPESLHRLFLPFEQIDRKKGLEGTGLGLSISKGYAEAMGGIIGATSTVGSGSNFHLSLRLVAVVADQNTRRTEHPHLAPPARSSETRILIVDDIAPGRILLRKLLTPLGVNIREAKDGQEALDAEDEWRPHIIFMDLRMPVMDGQQASTLIRERRGDDSPVIIAITASVFRENLLTPDSPFDEFVSKPFRIDDVLQMVGTHLT